MKRLLYPLLPAIVCITSLSSYSQTCGTTNIALSRPVTVPSQVQWHEGSLAVDGNLNTVWFADTVTKDTGYIYVDLGQSYTVCKANVTWDSNGRASDFLVQVSTDALNWTTMSTVTSNAAISNSIAVNGTGRYVRLWMTKRFFWWSAYHIVEFEVYNSLRKKPVVTLTAPANNSTIMEGSNLAITANAYDSVGTISRVDFYNGTVKLATATSPPYTYTWSNIYDGVYTFKAMAFNNLNDSATSDTAHVTVLPAPPGWSMTGSSGTIPGTNFLGTTDSKKLVLKTNNVSRMAILAGGTVTIGNDTSFHSDALLDVKGIMYAQKVRVTQLGWSDDVFDKGYRLRKLSDIEDYIKKHRHLPDVPAAKEVIGQQLDISETQSLLLRKIEELTLYIIEQHKKLQEQERRSKKLIDHLQQQINTLQKQVRPQSH